MLVYPAIDLIDGKCVRLTLGDFETSKVYNHDPLAMLKEFRQYGFSWVHLVDLDGAKATKVRQTKLISDLAKLDGINLQVGGGVRTEADIESLLAFGVKRVVLGSICVSSPSLVKKWLNKYGADKLVLALDCVLDATGLPVVKTHGWQDSSNNSIWELLDYYEEAKYVLCTDISVDGTLKGPNIGLYQDIMRRYPKIELIASGGVGSIDDLGLLNNLGVYAVVVGKAIYEGKIKLSEIITFIERSKL